MGCDSLSDHLAGFMPEARDRHREGVAFPVVGIPTA